MSFGGDERKQQKKTGQVIRAGAGTWSTRRRADGFMRGKFDSAFAAHSCLSLSLPALVSLCLLHYKTTLELHSKFQHHALGRLRAIEERHGCVGMLLDAAHRLPVAKA